MDELFGDENNNNSDERFVEETTPFTTTSVKRSGIERRSSPIRDKESIFFPEDKKRRRKRQTSDVPLRDNGLPVFDPNRIEFYYYADESGTSSRGIRCGSVILNDRFVLYAAHCQVSFSP